MDKKKKLSVEEMKQLLKDAVSKGVSADMKSNSNEPVPFGFKINPNEPKRIPLSLSEKATNMAKNFIGFNNIDTQGSVVDTKTGKKKRYGVGRWDENTKPNPNRFIKK